MNRKLNISFESNRDVCYHYWRSQPIRRYEIEFPASRVFIESPKEGFASSTTPEGFLQLHWPRPSTHSVTYVKRDLLKVEDSSNPNRFRYRETMHIKAANHFGLWLGAPAGRA